MPSTSFRITLFILLCPLLMTYQSIGQDNREKHIEVSLRMIAHKVLLSSGDSTSRVLPIIKEGNRYRIQLASEFGFVPEKLVSIIDDVVKSTQLSDHYIVEVEECRTWEMVYSFEMDKKEFSNIIPCKNRSQPKSCYHLLFTLMDSELLAAKTDSNQPTGGVNQLFYSIIASLVVIGLVLFFVIRMGSRKVVNPNMIALGEYRFDKHNTELLIEEQRIDLTSKESDLLLLLYGAANTTVEREVILNRVWGDEGDYVGRTLDVFISKLRKKLALDSKVKIVNIRGIGYKLVVNV